MAGTSDGGGDTLVGEAGTVFPADIVEHDDPHLPAEFGLHAGGRARDAGPLLIALNQADKFGLKFYFGRGLLLVVDAVPSQWPSYHVKSSLLLSKSQP